MKQRTTWAQNWQEFIPVSAPTRNLLLQGAARSGGGSPGPLKIESTKVAGDVNDFTDKEKSRDTAGFHGFAGEFAGIDAAGGDLRFFVALGGGRDQRPGVERLLKLSNAGIGVMGWGVEFDPARGETVGEKFLDGFAGGGGIAMSGGPEFRGCILPGSQVELDRFALFPARGELENGRAAEPAMSEEHFFAEGTCTCRGRDDFGGDTGEFGVAAMIGAIENERHKSGARRDEVMAELAGEVVTERGGAHFRDGQSAGGDYQGGSTKFGDTGTEDEFGGAPDFNDAGVKEDLNMRGATFRLEHVGDFSGGIVAEELAESFFVISDAMFFKESKKIGGGEAGERGFGEVGICGNKIFRRGVNVGEIAAATAGDENFFADAVGVLEDGDSAATLPCLNGAEEASGAGAED